MAWVLTFVTRACVPAVAIDPSNPVFDSLTEGVRRMLKQGPHHLTLQYDYTDF